LILVVFFLFAFIINLCGFADIVKDTLDLDDTKDDQDDDLPDDDDDLPPEEEDEPESDPLHCSNVRYGKSTDGVTTTWTAIGMPESTFLESKSQITGGFKWKAYWNKNPLGHISPEYATRFLLNTYLQGLPNNDIYNEQQWWYDCMMTTGYGGIF
jgi:hypothetical protein